MARRWTLTEGDEQLRKRGQKGIETPPPTFASEHDFQCAVILLCELMEQKYPALNLIYAIANGGAGRTRSEGGRLKSEGVKPGMPDLHLPVARGPFISLYIELKLPGNYPSPAQEFKIQQLTEELNDVHVCYSLAEVKRVIDRHLSNPP